MGINFSHGGASWSYSGFSRARHQLAIAVGVNLDEMIGFGGTKEWPDSDTLPLVYLLHHSDCDGDLSPDQCRVVAPALRKVVESWFDHYDRQMFLRLADGMEEAAKENVPLEFQ